MNAAAGPGATAARGATVLGDGQRAERLDQVVVEAPLEVRVAEERVMTTLRTPGRDTDLALGFLFCEGVIDTVDDVGAVAHCGRPGDPGRGNTLEVTPGAGVSLDVERAQRAGLTSAACGACGRAQLDDLVERFPPLPLDPQVELALVLRAPALLATQQPLFERTGGLHAAAAIAADGSVRASAEDVGRHNAVDKVVGALLREGALPRRAAGAAAPVLLAVSGRAGFDIAYKAAAAGFGVLASVSAASSLAIATAQAAGVTLAAFVRGGRCTVYSHPARLR